MGLGCSEKRQEERYSVATEAVPWTPRNSDAQFSKGSHLNSYASMCP